MPTIQVPALTQIEIDRVFQPFPDSKTWKDGARRGAIKTKGGVKYQVKETLLNQFTDGETCQVEVKTFGDKDNPGREIVKKVGWNGQAGLPKQNTRPAAAPRESEQIWCTAHSKKILPALYDPSLGLDEASSVKLIEALRRVYAKTFGGTQAQTRDDMNDSIGF